MSVTLADVAAACGISPSTVSRALSDPDKVNAATRKRVQQVANRMGYTPSRAARSLSIGRTGTIGLIVPDIANPFFPPLIKTVQSRATARANAVLLADTDEHVADELPRARAMRKDVDGLIMVSPRTSEARMEELIQLGPIVFVNRQVPGATCVTIESANGINDAIEHLSALGHRNICYLNGPRRSWSNAQRHKAIRAACKSRGVELTEFGPFEAQVQAGVRAADLVLASDATAVLAYDDLIALGVMGRIAERGLRVGHDVSVIGIDDSPMSSVMYPTLTSIHVPNAEAGALAVDLLLDLLEGVEGVDPDETELETHLVIRGSTGPVPA
ncbi:LacI family DNA-binding transcriptional regulator [Tenggerimyces flavus]|uniref:LacI family DNA-binding transcriptional regulator n=1 Tax=Tenggerimyces flavus TaxID=1708749 RepID=A0ABV7YL38_9ACTN|nr:LacI family DNA-binding transcriptional regulator [Tenggerimyces flavus]MBM7789665.1 DNA-binding LacI/PurR family transcriptional regulator [Tenggerimyces flavus]